MTKVFKYSALAILVLFILQPAMAQEEGAIKWYSFEEAIKLNKKKKKKFFVDLYTDWCGWCKKMDASTFQDPVIAEYMNENFYPIKFDAETSDTITVNGQEFVNPKPGTRRSSHQLAIALLNGKMSYPSFAFLDEDVKLITVLPGYNTPEKLEPVLHFIADEAYKKESYQDYFSGFKGSFGQ
jgi:thioredoxin-related protein